MQTKDINDLGEWGDPRTVNTRNGERILRKAPASPAFWKLWKKDNDGAREAGLSCKKEDDGSWAMLHWAKPDKAEAERQIEASWAEDSDMDIPCPEGLSYLPYQRGGIAYAVGRKNTLIADEMGLGKTIQALGVANAINADLDRPIRLLIVCPATLKGNWRREAVKWLVDDLLDICIVDDGKDVDATKADVVVINYELVGKHLAALREREWDLVVVDEAHYVKNSKTARTKAILGSKDSKGLLHSANRFVGLTGTPILNRPIELWTLAKACAPDVFSSWKRYVERYCDGHSGRFGWVTDGASNLDELQTNLRRSFMVRRLKKDVLKDLPAKRRQVIELPPTSAMRRILDAETRQWQLHEDTLDSLRDRAEAAEVNGDEEAHRDATRQLSEAQMVAFQEMAKVRHDTAVAKIPLVVQHLKDMLEGSDEKILVFAHHLDVIDALKAELAEYLPQVIDGRVKNVDRIKIVDRFQNSTKSRVFIGGIKAAGVGLTLTSAQTVVFVELDWTPAANTQAEDRAHRIGQTGSVLIQHLVLQGSLDAKMAKDCVSKQEVLDASLDTGASKSLPDNWEGVDEAPPAGSGAPKKRRNPKWRDIGERMTATQRALAHRCVKEIAAMDGDRASSRNGVGFSKLDTFAGNELAAAPTISVGQAALARHFAIKYRRQLDPRLWEPLQELAD